MDGVNKPDENGKISNLLDPETETQSFGRKLQNWPNLMDENGILLQNKIKSFWRLTLLAATNFMVDSLTMRSNKGFVSAFTGSIPDKLVP
ncbi:hypothetical protein Hanom_Chr10g00944371 [Helianthus anomalus]